MNVTEIGDLFQCDCGFSWFRGHSGSHDCGVGLRRKMAEHKHRMDWLESMHTLHGEVQILYVVTGYHLSNMFDDCEIAEVEGGTLAEAIDNAIAAGWKPMTRGDK